MDRFQKTYPRKPAYEGIIAPAYPYASSKHSFARNRMGLCLTIP
jgi:hypothetical protein